MPLRPMIPKNSPFFHFKADIIKRFEFFIPVGSKSIHKSPAQARDLLVGYAESFGYILSFDGDVVFHSYLIILLYFPIIFLVGVLSLNLPSV